MERFRWLLFLDTNKTSEELFRTVYIPFNCEFLLARRLNGEDQMLFSEVYRIQPEYSLEENQLTLQLLNSANSFNVLYEPLYHRRRDLKGTLFKAGTRKVLIFTHVYRGICSTYEWSHRRFNSKTLIYKYLIHLFIFSIFFFFISFIRSLLGVFIQEKNLIFMDLFYKKWNHFSISGK